MWPTIRNDDFRRRGEMGSGSGYRSSHHIDRIYPEASDERCTAALLLDVDPVGLVRGTARCVSAAGW